MTDELVRIKLADGAEVTHTRSYAEDMGLTILDKPAVNGRGGGLDPKPPIDLRGKELDDALKAAGLPTSGTAAEKRDRLSAQQSITVSDGSNQEESS